MNAKLTQVYDHIETARHNHCVSGQTFRKEEPSRGEETSIMRSYFEDPQIQVLKACGFVLGEGAVITREE